MSIVEMLEAAAEGELDPAAVAADLDWTGLNEVDFLNILEKADTWSSEARGARLLWILLHGLWNTDPWRSLPVLSRLLLSPEVNSEDKVKGLERMRQRLDRLSKEQLSREQKLLLKEFTADSSFLAGMIALDRGDAGAAAAALRDAEKSYRSLGLTRKVTKTVELRLEIETLQAHGQNLIPLDTLRNQRELLGEQVQKLKTQIAEQMALLETNKAKIKQMTLEISRLTEEAYTLENRVKKAELKRVTASGRKKAGQKGKADSAADGGAEETAKE